MQKLQPLLKTNTKQIIQKDDVPILKPKPNNFMTTALNQTSIKASRCFAYPRTLELNAM